MDYARRYGINPVITSTRRSYSEQARLYANWKAGLAKYPAAAPGTSAHQYGVAWDSTVPDDQVATWAAIRRAFGWTVPDSDIIHSEYPGWQGVASQLRYS